MKSHGWTAFAALLLVLSFTTPRSAAGEAAFGIYRFVLEDDAVKTLELDVSKDARGRTSGRMVFRDETRIADTDDPEDPRLETPPELLIDVDIHSLTTDRERAALMTGVIRDSSHRNYIGSWVQLVIKDSGDNPRVPDQLTWQICRRRPGGWIPSDAELASDDGAFLHWWATDAELRDDVGVPSVDLLGRDEGCVVYPLALYPFADLRLAEGDLVVRP